MCHDSFLRKYSGAKGVPKGTRHDDSLGTRRYRRDTPAPCWARSASAAAKCTSKVHAPFGLRRLPLTPGESIEQGISGLCPWRALTLTVVTAKPALHHTSGEECSCGTAGNHWKRPKAGLLLKKLAGNQAVWPARSRSRRFRRDCSRARTHNFSSIFSLMLKEILSGPAVGAQKEKQR